MTPVESLTLEIDAFERHLGRRRFLRAVALAGGAAAGACTAARGSAAGTRARSASALTSDAGTSGRAGSAGAGSAAGPWAYDRAFLEAVARTLIGAEALQTTGIDLLANVDHLLTRASARHRASLLRALGWARRLAFVYGGERFATETRDSRFIVIRRLGRLVSSLCLLAFWGDERSLPLLDAPPGAITTAVL